MKFICASDLHFGHRKVPSIDTANNLRSFLFPQLNDTVDVLFLNGDIFDAMVSINSIDSIIILELFTDLLFLCDKHNIKIRILRGTYSHDHKQLEFISKLKLKLNLSVDYKMYDTLSVEYIKEFDKNILYLPDNLPFGTKYDMFDHISKLFQVINIDKVDFIMMHGELTHMIFGHVSKNSFDVSELNRFCKGWIFSGHIHKPLKYKNSISIGSFNRLAHNEEESKGFWLFDQKPIFIKNEEATIFKTINLSHIDDIQKIILKYQEEVDILDKDKKSFIRVLIKDSHLKQTLNKFSLEYYPHVVLTFKNNITKTTEEDDFLNKKLFHDKHEYLEAPSLENIASIVFNDLQSKGLFIDIEEIKQIINVDIF